MRFAIGASTDSSTEAFKEYKIEVVLLGPGITNDRNLYYVVF
jgi:hypothetical protein